MSVSAGQADLLDELNAMMEEEAQGKLTEVPDLPAKPTKVPQQPSKSQ